MTELRLPNIPEEIFGARPLLKQVREHAHARAAGADAVLAVFLTSVAAYIDARVAVDTGVGVPVRPTLFSVLASAPGIGKSISAGVGRSLVPGLPAPLTPSTGQGLVESFYGTVLVEQPQPDGKPPKLVKVRKRIVNNRLFYLDEGEALFKQMAQAGSVLGENLRSFWSGGPVGQANATEGSRRTLDAGTYTGGLIIGLQPDIAGHLLSDTATGTAQRFLWFTVTDPTIPDRPALDPFALGPLDWSPPTLPGGEPARGGLQAWAVPNEETVWREPEPLTPVLMRVDPGLTEEIVSYQVRLRRGEEQPEAHDSQRTAQHIKLAGVLAWLDSRMNVATEDWEIASRLLDASAAVRDALIEHAEVVTARSRAERGIERAQVSKAETQAEANRESCEARITDLLVGKPDGQTHNEIKKSLSQAQRPFLAEVIADLIDRAVVRSEPTPRGGRRYRLGNYGT